MMYLYTETLVIAHTDGGWCTEMKWLIHMLSENPVWIQNMCFRREEGLQKIFRFLFIFL